MCSGGDKTRRDTDGPFWLSAMGWRILAAWCLCFAAMALTTALEFRPRVGPWLGWFAAAEVTVLLVVVLALQGLMSVRPGERAGAMACLAVAALEIAHLFLIAFP